MTLSLNLDTGLNLDLGRNFDLGLNLNFVLNLGFLCLSVNFHLSFLMSLYERLLTASPSEVRFWLCR